MEKNRISTCSLFYKAVIITYFTLTSSGPLAANTNASHPFIALKQRNLETYGNAGYYPKTGNNYQTPDTSRSLAKGLIMGFLKAPDILEETPSFRIFFEGQATTSNNEGFFSIPVEERYETLYLLICNRFHHSFDKTNTIKGLAIKTNKYYKCFKIFKNTETQEWDFSQIMLKQASQASSNEDEQEYELPRHCIIVLLNPAYVDHLEPWKIELPSTTYKLPKIVLKDNVIPEEQLNEEEKQKGKGTLARAARKSKLYACDAGVFHREIPVEKREFSQKSHVKVSITG
jgi:hypothetical protein